MARQRNFSSDFKAKVALAAIRGDGTAGTGPGAGHRSEGDARRSVRLRLWARLRSILWGALRIGPVPGSG